MFGGLSAFSVAMATLGLACFYLMRVDPNPASIVFGDVSARDALETFMLVFGLGFLVSAALLLIASAAHAWCAFRDSSIEAEKKAQEIILRFEQANRAHRPDADP